MTLSNFNWTDKDSVRWFVLLPTGHEGPYSLKELQALREKKKLAIDIKIWTEGLEQGISLRTALEKVDIEKQREIPVQVADELPPLPEEDIPPLPEEKPVIHATPAKATITLPLPLVAVPFALGLIFIGYQFLSSRLAKVDLHRAPKMSVPLFEKIQAENQFEGWDKKIFFKEYVPEDHSHIWLVTASFQSCDVEAQFNSLPDKLLTLNDEEVSFRTSGKLQGHVVEFSKFDFTKGNRIIPGMYEVDIKATDCDWETLTAKIKNFWRPVEADYQARTKVVLFTRGAEAFTTNLAQLLQKKEEIKLREKNENEVFWEDLQQKLETLLAISLQIEQHFLDYIDDHPGKFKKNLNPMVDSYTRKFGSFLTSFVVENENYFKGLSGSAKGASEKRNYELIVRLSAKKIGLESMKYIEEFQLLKKEPVKAQLGTYSKRIRSTFSSLKKELNEKLSQVAEDRKN